jgi:hypothetical protein
MRAMDTGHAFSPAFAIDFHVDCIPVAEGDGTRSLKLRLKRIMDDSEPRSAKIAKKFIQNLAFYISSGFTV